MLAQWFSYHGRDRSRPLIGDRRPPSPLGDIQPAGWPAEYTAELLHVLSRLVALKPRQADLLARLYAGPLVPAALAGLAPSPARRTTRRNERQGELMGD